MFLIGKLEKARLPLAALRESDSRWFLNLLIYLLLPTEYFVSIEILFFKKEKTSGKKFSWSGNFLFVVGLLVLCVFKRFDIAGYILYFISNLENQSGRIWERPRERDLVIVPHD